MGFPKGALLAVGLVMIISTGFDGLVLGSSSLVGTAQATSHHQLIDAHDVHGVGWVAWRVQITEPDSLLLWGYDGEFTNATRAHWVQWLVTPEGTSGNFVHRWLWNEHTYAQLDGDTIIHECDCEDNELRRDYWGWWGPGEYTIIALAATDGRYDGLITLHADPGVELLAKTAGDEVYSWSEPEFRSAASAVVRRDPVGSPLFITKASVMAARSVEINNELWGQMILSDASLSACIQLCVTTTTKIHKAAWEGPSGLGEETPLPPERYVWTQQMAGLPAGHYQYRVDLDLQHTTTGPRPYVFALAADILPP